MLPEPTGRSCLVAATGCPTSILRPRRAGANRKRLGGHNRSFNMQFASRLVLVSRGSAARWRWRLLPLAPTWRPTGSNDGGAAQGVADEVRASDVARFWSRETWHR